MDDDKVAAPPAKPNIERLIDEWWEHHFQGSALATMTQVWNHAQSAKEDLKVRMKKALG